MKGIVLRPIGWVEQVEGETAELHILPELVAGLEGLSPGDKILTDLLQLEIES